MKDSQVLDRQFEVAYQRFHELMERSGGWLEQESPLGEALKALSTGLEELHIAGEALCRQNEELVAARQSLEAERRQAESQREAALSQRETALEEAYSLARFPSENPNPVLRLDQAGILLYANEASASLLGEWSCRVGEPVPPPWRTMIVEAFAEGATRVVDVPSNGHVYSFFVVPIVEAGYVNLYGRDITVRVQAEDQLRASEARSRFLADILERASQPFAVGYPDGRLGIFNAAYCDLVGYSPEELRALDWSVELTPPEWRAIEAGYLAELHRTSQPVRYEKEYIRKNGARVPVELLVHLVRDEAGAPQYYYSFITDITERKQAISQREAALAERGRLMAELQAANEELQVGNEELQSQAEELEVQAEELRCQADELHFQTLKLEGERARLKAIIDSTPEAILVADEGGQIVMANPAAEHLFAAPGPGAAGLEHYITVTRYHPDHTPIARRDLALFRAAAHRESHHDEPQILLWPDGQRRDMLVSAVPIVDEHGKTHGAVAVYQDVTERLRAESEREAARAALRDSEQRFGSLVASMTEGVALHSIAYDTQGQAVDYTILDVNPAFEAITGLTRDQALGRKASELYGTDQPPYLETYAQVAASGEPASFETHFPPMDKHFSISVFSPGAGQFATVFSDTTERVRTEQERERLLAEVWAKNEELQSQTEEMEAQAEELRSQAEELQHQTRTLEEGRARLRTIIDSTPEAILVADERGEVTLVNPAAERLFAAPVPGDGGLEYYGQVTRYRPDHTPYELHERPCFRAAVHRETQRDTPIALLWPDGRWRDVLVNAAPIIDSHGQVHGAVAAYQDITDRVQATQALRETRDYLDNLLTYAHAPIIVWDPNFKITRFNSAFERLTGLKAGDVLGRELDILFPEDRKEEAMAYIRRAVAGERWEAAEIPIRHVDGTAHTVLWNSATLYAADGATPVATIAQGQDITQRVQAEEALRATLAEKEVLMREIYHRVKNNLQALIYLMDMQADYIQDEATRQMIQELQERARSMALVHEKLYQSHNLAQIDFGDYLHELVDNLSNVFETGGSIVWRVEAENALLSVDSAIPCGLVVTELLTNAMKYAFPDGQPCVERGETECKIDVEFRADGERFTLVVADNGIGLPPGLDWTATPSLGLQLINVLARHQLGGQVEVDTQAGTAFKITFIERRKR